MNYLPFLLAKKFDSNENKNHRILLISILSKIGIFISVFSLIVGVSALNGFEILLNKTVSSHFPHGIIKFTHNSIYTWNEIKKKIGYIDGLKYYQPYIMNHGFLIHNEKIKLIDIKIIDHIKNLKINNAVKIKKKNMTGIILSLKLASDLSIKKGDVIHFICLDQNSNQPNFKNYSLNVIEIFKSQDILHDDIGYIPFSFFQNSFNKNNKINAVEFYMFNPFQTDEILLNISNKLNTPVVLYTWMNIYKKIYDDCKMIKAIVYLSLFFLVIISCFTITSISFMTISRKTREIAILRSIGANNFLIQTIFLYYGIRSIIYSTVFGLLCGVVVVLNFTNILFILEKYFQENLILNNVYYNHFLLLKLNIFDVIMIFIATLLTGIITNVFPSYYASKILPKKILKKF